MIQNNSLKFKSQEQEVIVKEKYVLVDMGASNTLSIMIHSDINAGKKQINHT